MKLKIEQLARHLASHLLPVYVISGEETLLVDEAASQIRQAATSREFQERDVLQVDSRFDWDELRQSASSMSLFSSKKLLELRVGNGKLGAVGGKALCDYAKQPPQDLVLLVIGEQFDRQIVATGKWYQQLEKVGAVMQAWPVTARELPVWIGVRMESRNLTPVGRSAEILAELVQGNLYAAAQEIEKLSLLYSAGSVVDEQQVIDAVSDSSRFKLFDLADAVWEGRSAQVTRVLDGLREEGVEPILVLWLVTRELRNLLQQSRAGGGAKLPYLPPRQKALLDTAARRKPHGDWQSLLKQTARLDRCLKGLSPGNPWFLLQQLCLNMAGRPLPVSDPDGQYGY